VLGPFVVDFACHGAKLIIEIDGGAHDAPDVAERDYERQQWIEGRGYRVLRFKNADVIRDVRAVARKIFAEATLQMRAAE
jgi:very-short-patch-repair endonuclease